jgi:phage terminase large subunit-like protein
MTRSAARASRASPRSRGNSVPKLSTEVIDWIQEHCRIPEGKHVGRKVELRPWQKREIRKIYDNPHGTRRAILSFGRKNGKTALAAFLLLVHLCGPTHRKNSQLYSAAQSRDQAAILFGLAAKIVRMSPSLTDHVTVRDSGKQLHCPELGTLYRALSAEASTAYGLSPVFVVHDELGQVRGPRSELYEALETAVAAHEQPLSVIISTQSPTDADLLSVLIDDAKAGTDKRVVLSLYTAEPELDPFAKATIKKANPAFGDFQNADEVLAMAEDARRMPSRESEYRNLILNQRVQTSSPFVSKAVWASCDGQPAPMEGQDVWFGLDLSGRADLTAAVAVLKIDGQTHVHPFFWTPADGLHDRARLDRVPYDLWVQQGYLRTTPGATVDYEYVVADLAEIISDCYVRGLAFDRWRIDVFKKELDRAGIDLPMVPHGQGFKDMSPALDTLEAELLNGRLRHGGHPVLTMCAANAVVTKDPAGNRKLDKGKANGRIDGMVALAMALAAASGGPEEYAVGRLITL